MIHRLLSLVTIAAALLLSGCGPSKMEAMDDHTLDSKYSYCLDRQPTSPGKVTACENLRKECERRAQNGRYVCRTH